MDKLLLFTLLESIYIIFILNHFKTKYNFVHPLTYFENKFLYHPIGKVQKPTNMICPFGHICSYMLSFFLIIRYIMVKKKLMNKNSIRVISVYVLIISILLSFMNFNAVIYLIPYFIIESYIINQLI